MQTLIDNVLSNETCSSQRVDNYPDSSIQNVTLDVSLCYVGAKIVLCASIYSIIFVFIDHIPIDFVRYYLHLGIYCGYFVK
jgi:hypothetical protein